MKKLVFIGVYLLTVALAWAQDTVYFCDFDQPGDTSGWRFAGEDQSHFWVVGSRMLFVTYNGVDNGYYWEAPSSVSYAYRRIMLPRGAYRFGYDWRCNGRRDGDTAYDYMRVLLVRGTTTPIGGRVPDGMGTMSDAVLPAGYIPLDGNEPLCASSVWVRHSSDCFVEDSGVYTLVFMWYSSVAQWDPPAAVDNLMVTRPLCPQPGHLFVSPLTPTAFTVHWSDFSEGNTPNWQVELCTALQTVGQGIRQTVHDTSAEFTNLTPNTDYWVYVSSLCDSDTTTPIAVHVHTPCAGLDSLPYIQNFDSAQVGTLPQCWRVLRTAGNATVRSDTAGNVLQWRIAYSGYCCVVLPSVDVNVVPSGGLQLSFRCKEQSSYLPFSHEFEVGLLPNPNNVGSFVPISRVMVNSDQWEQCVVEFDGYSGDNIAILDMGNDLIEGYAWFDDFVIGAASACQPVEHLTVGGTSVAGAMVRWDLPRGMVHEPSGYEVCVEPVDTLVPNPLEPGAASLHFSSTERRCIVSGLQPFTTYRVWVRAQCAESVYGEWRNVVFVTLPLPCEAGDTATADTASVGNGINRISGVPVSNMFVNSLCQSIYTADEMLAEGVGIGVISGLDYVFTNNPHDMLVSIYVSTTSDSLYATTDDMVEVNAGGLVYGPALHAAGTGGTVHYEFDRPFSWNGVDNLVVTSIFNNAVGAMQSASFFGNSTQTVGNRTVRSYLNDVPFTTANALEGASALSNYRPSVTFHTMECGVLSTCAPPAVIVQSVGEDYAMVDWTPGYRENEWSVFYRQTGDSVWTLASSLVDTNRYLLPLLEANTGYDVRVVPHCGGDSIYGEAHFTTSCASVYELPFSEGFEDFEASRLNVEDFEDCWYRGYPIPSYTSGCTPDGEGGGGYIGTYYLSLNHISGSRWPVYIATPAMAMDVSELQVNFFINCYYRYQLRIGVMTDPTDYSTFEEVVRLSGDATYGWVQKEVSLAGYSGEGRHIALLLNENWVMIDDLTVDYIQTCPRPRDVSFGIITRSTAEVQWDGGESGSYELEYGPSGFAHGTGTLLECGADTVTLRGLSHSSDYDVYVRSFCGDDTSRWSIVATFSTQCGEIESLPYTQNFEDLGGRSYPRCWTCGNASVVSYLPMGGQRQEKALHLRGAYAILPAVDSSLGAVQTLQLVVKASSDNNYGEIYSHDLIVGVCSTEGDFTTFNPLDTITLTPISTVYELPLTAAAGVGRYITLRSTPTGRALNNRVYIDSLAIEPIPTCARPRRLTVTNISTTSATVTWSGATGASAWQVEYMPHGNAIGTGLRQTTSTDTLTINGLTPATTYDYYVRSICGAGDTSEWCSAPGFIVTQQLPAPVPYEYGFDTVAEWNSWQGLTNCAAAWCRGMADGLPAPSIYLSVDSGATRAILFNSNTVVNSAVYRDFDFGNRDTSYVISFSVSVDGTQAGTHDGLAVFLVNPVVIPNMPSNYAQESPWGSLSDLPLLADIQSPRNWSNYHFTIDSLNGVWRLVFYWYGSGINYTPAAVDNISIQYEACQHPYSVHAVEVASGSATITWHGPAYADYSVKLFNTDMSLLSYDTVHTNSIQYNTLVPGNTYKVRVRRLCDSVSSLDAPLFTFSTNACAGGTLDLVEGISRGTTYCLPVNNIYRYSYTQQLILASELGGAGDVSSIGFLYDSPGRMTQKTNCTIYMGHTTLSSFSSSGDTVPYASLQMVYVGSLNCSQGWNRILLETPFAYDGVSNLVIAIDDNSNRSHNYTFYFASSETVFPMSRSYYGIEDIDCASLSSLPPYSVDMGVYRYRNVINVEICPPNECPRPRLRTPRVRANDITLHWRNTSDRYLVGYRLTGSDRWIENDVLTTDTFFTITNYYFDSDYVYHVRQYCADGVSNWSIGTFNTAEIPCLPPLGLHATDIANHSVHLSWTPEDNNIGYCLHVWGGGLDTIVTTYLATGTTIDCLYTATRYYASVQVQCEYFDEPSIWSDTISFVTDVCPDATDLTDIEVHGNSVLLDWQCEEGVDGWFVEWGLEGFDQGTGTTVNADHHPFLLTGLTGETTYDIYVRSICGEDFYSENWSNRLTITTAYSDIHSATDDARIRLCPNPAHGDVELRLPATAGRVKIEVVDMAGRKMALQVLDIFESRVRLSTSTLPSGTYYLRIGADDLNAVKKLVLK